MFCSSFVGSMVIGLLGGVCASFLFGRLQLRWRPESALLTEAGLSFVFPWVSCDSCWKHRAGLSEDPAR